MDEKEAARLDLEKKIDEIDQRVDSDFIRKRLKLALLKKADAGDITAISDLEKLKALESAEAAAAAAPQPLSPAASGDEGTPSGPETEEKRKAEVLDRLHIRPRQYTLTEAALAQRKAAAGSAEKAKSMLGNKNAWKTGQHAQGFVRQLFRPCLSTCPQYPCELIDDGETAAGSVCLDKAEFVKGLHALQKALRTNDLTDYKELAAIRLAGGFDILGRLQEDILENGVKCFDEKIDKEGKVVGYGLKPNPSLLALPKLMEVLGVSTAELMISPREIKRQKTEARKARTLGDFMSQIGMPGSDDDGGDD